MSSDLDDAMMVAPERSAPVYEVRVYERWLTVSDYIWRSWTGRRRLNGRDAHGPVFVLGTNEVSESVRSCGCMNCYSLYTGWRLDSWDTCAT